jgi:hypothetical protein
MTIAKFAFLLLGMAILIFIAGYAFFVRGKSKMDFNESISFMRAMIKNAPLTEQGYRDCLTAFHEFNYISYRNEKVYKSLYTGFLFKYRDFLPASDEPRIKIIPDGEGVYNYKIEV